MELSTYVSDVDRRRALAERVGKSADYLWQVATGWNDRKPSPELAALIENATRDLGPECVPAESMRSDVAFVRDAQGVVTGYHTPLAGAAA